VAGLAYRSRFADPQVDRLFEAILALRDQDECYRFFEDLCTVGEVRALAQRLHAAELLQAGATYEDISVATGMSSATISRIKRFLVYGADGYRLVLARLGADPAAGGAAADPPADAD
jgi:TrpR-related protein YerC/YecD